MSTRHVWIPSLAIALLACGGTVVYDEDTSSSGDGGASAQSGTSSSRSSSGSGGASTASNGTGTSAVSSGSAQGGGSSVSGTTGPSSSGVTVGPGSGGGSSCSDLNYAECLGAVDRCVPQFDDLCCSSCFPGECADCIDFQAVGCIDRENGGTGGAPPPGGCGFPSCGFVPDWACNGDKPDCTNGCFGVPGCVEKQECVGDGCGITCDGVAPDACGPVNCNAAPPECFGGLIPEAAGGCWTGLCIPSWVCQFVF